MRKSVFVVQRLRKHRFAAVQTDSPFRRQLPKKLIGLVNRCQHLWWSKRRLQPQSGRNWKVNWDLLVLGELEADELSNHLRWACNLLDCPSLDRTSQTEGIVAIPSQPVGQRLRNRCAERIIQSTRFGPGLPTISGFGWSENRGIYRIQGK